MSKHPTVTMRLADYEARVRELEAKDEAEPSSLTPDQLQELKDMADGVSIPLKEYHELVESQARAEKAEARVVALEGRLFDSAQIPNESTGRFRNEG